LAEAALDHSHREGALSLGPQKYRAWVLLNTCIIYKMLPDTSLKVHAPPQLLRAGLYQKVRTIKS